MRARVFWPLALAFACSGLLAQQSAKVATVTVTPDALTLEKGDTGVATCTPRNKSGTALKTVCSWKSADTTVAKPSSSTQQSGVRARKVGKTTLTASAGGKVSLLVPVTVVDTVTAPAPPPPPPQCTGSPTTFAVGDNFQAKVSAQPNGTAFTLCPGVHRLQSVTPKAGQTFSGPADAVMSGAQLVTGWTGSGPWTAPVSYTAGTASGTCLAGTNNACQKPNDVYRDDVLLRTGYTLTATTLTVTDDPTGHRIELATIPRAFGGAAANVTLSGFTVEKYAPVYNQGAVQAGGSTTGWHVTIIGRWNHAAAVALFGSASTIQGSHLYENGQYGCLANGLNQSVLTTEVDHNNTAGFDPAWAAGGCKFSSTTNLVVRGDNFHQNQGHAFWADIDNRNALFENDTATDNAKRGFFYEVSYAAVIRNNYVARNGLSSLCGAVLLRCSGIGVVNSDSVEVYGNVLIGNRDGITGVQDARGSYNLTHLRVHDNQIDSTVAAAGGIVQAVNDTTFYGSKDNLWTGNSYNGSQSAKPFYWMNAPKTPAEWAAYGLQ